jgi:hypothetical protein
MVVVLSKWEARSDTMTGLPFAASLLNSTGQFLFTSFNATVVMAIVLSSSDWGLSVQSRSAETSFRLI